MLVQLPAISLVLKLNHQVPSVSGALVVELRVAEAFMVCAGVAVAPSVHEVENPSTPETVSVAPEMLISTVLSEYGVFVAWLVLITPGSVGKFLSTFSVALLTVSVLLAVSAEK